MSAAILQGVPATTLDTDLWVDLPQRQYIRVLRICQKLGASIRANTVVDLSDGSVVNFLYEVHGLNSFRAEWPRAKKIHWLGQTVAILPLESIIKSKRFVGRPKDIAHLPLLEQTVGLVKTGRKKADRAKRPG